MVPYVPEGFNDKRTLRSEVGRGLSYNQLSGPRLFGSWSVVACNGKLVSQDSVTLAPVCSPHARGHAILNLSAKRRALTLACLERGSHSHTPYRCDHISSQITGESYHIGTTDYAVTRIAECGGLDAYLLNTPEEEIDSQFGVELKRLLHLVRRIVLKFLPHLNYPFLFFTPPSLFISPSPLSSLYLPYQAEW